MIASLNGVLAFKKPSNVTLDVRGVGYDVQISSRTYDVLPETGEECFLFIQTNVREDAIALFGFSQMETKELFLLLTGVSGIGPKLALAILSGLSVQELCSAISLEDIARLTSISGVGKKTAQRLCVELSEKVGSLSVAGQRGVTSSVSVKKEGQGMQDAVSALVNLGYPQHTAWQALRRVQKQSAEFEKLSVEELIRLALQGMA